MSYIDTSDHSYVGTIFDLPHPLSTYDDEFNADPSNLVIGGGSGEHPAMVIRSLDICVLYFIEFVCSMTEVKEPEYCNTHSERLDEYYMNELDYSWGMRNVEKFSASINKHFESLIIGGDKIFPYHTENRLLIMLGEFLFYSGRKLLSKELQADIQDFDASNLALFSAVNVPPPGYPVSGRLTFRHGDQYKVMWGLRFDDEPT
jgi:hypothetical protein